MLEHQIKKLGTNLGFDLVGIAPAQGPESYPQFVEWLEKGYAGEMDYMQRHGPARKHPRSILDGVQSIILLAMNYKPPEVLHEKASENLTGRISIYALGQDYHDLIRRRLNQFLAEIQKLVPECTGRGVVDTAPLLERDFARRAGLGWFGKNTMLLNKKLGSYFFLGALLVNLELQPDEPHSASHCGTCTACLDACPTDAFVGPGELDSRRCISYLTIELKGSIPEDLRPGMGECIFGCDICQEVCPWNRKAPKGKEADLFSHPERQATGLIELLSLTEEQFRRRFKGTALFRPKRIGLQRNAAIVLGNLGDERALPALKKAALSSESVLQEAAEWAIQQILGESEKSLD